MPPPILDNASDDESTGESIPFDDNDKTNQDEDSDKDNENEEDEDLYVVEAILQHDWTDKNVLIFKVKWKGYENPEDQTWEPEENLSGAKELLEEYFTKIGGRPQLPPKQAPRKRKSMGEKHTPAKAQAPKETKRRKKSRGATDDDAEDDQSELALAGEDDENWMPKKENWENEVVKVDTIGRDPEGGDGLYAYLHWKNGKRSKVSMELCYKKCPIKMLRFYEQHLVFKDG